MTAIAFARQAEDVAPGAAEAFIVGLGEPLPDSIDLAIATYDNGTMIGAAVLGPTVSGTAVAVIVVDTGWRRLGIGRSLMHDLVAAATSRGTERLRITYPARSTAADALVRSSGLIFARRTSGGVATAILLLADEC